MSQRIQDRKIRYSQEPNLLTLIECFGPPRPRNTSSINARKISFLDASMVLTLPFWLMVKPDLVKHIQWVQVARLVCLLKPLVLFLAFSNLFLTNWNSEKLVQSIPNSRSKYPSWSSTRKNYTISQTQQVCRGTESRVRQ